MTFVTGDVWIRSAGSDVLRVTGLDRGLPAGLERMRPSRAVHDPGKIIANLP
jgi:hypothetical protein